MCLALKKLCLMCLSTARGHLTWCQSEGQVMGLPGGKHLGNSSFLQKTDDRVLRPFSGKMYSLRRERLKFLKDSNIYIHIYIYIYLICILYWSILAQTIKNLPKVQQIRFNPWVGKTPWRGKWQHTPVFLPGKSHGQRSLVGYSPWGHKRVKCDWASNTFTFFITD